jgi:hypothetical protein
MKDNELAPPLSVNLLTFATHVNPPKAGPQALMPTAMLSASRHSLRHVELGRQFLGDAQIAFVYANPNMLRLRPAEGFQQLVLLGFAEGLVGHSKQAMVFFVNVISQQSDERAGVLDKSSDRGPIAGLGRRDCLIHSGYAASANLVLVEHDSRGTAFAREALGLHRREEVRLLLAVMTTIGEVSQEVDRFSSGRHIDLARTFGTLCHLFQTVKHLFNDPVLATENIAWFHKDHS